MSEQHVLADALCFAYEAGEFQRRMPFSQLDRLAGLLADDQGSFMLKVSGTQDDQQRPCLILSVEAELVLSCQRCLGALQWPLSQVSRLVLIRAGERDEDEALADDSYDVIEVDGELDLMRLAEEEILLALPIAPCHEMNCLLPQGVSQTASDSPFAVLGGLLGASKK